MKNKNDITDDLKAAMRANLRDELKAELKEAEAGISPKSRVILMRKWLSVAAGIVLFILAGLYFISNAQVDNKQLFADYFEPFDNLVLPVNRSKNDTTTLISLREAYSNYEAKNYEKAAILFENIKANFPVNLDNEFYLALSYLATDNPEKAQLIFENLSRQNDFHFTQQADWYLGLTYLKMGENEKAKEVFSGIVNRKAVDEHPFGVEANEILSKLEF